METAIVFMGRYGRQSMNEVEQWGPAKLWRRVTILEEFLRAEAGKGSGMGPGEDQR